MTSLVRRSLHLLLGWDWLLCVTRHGVGVGAFAFDLNGCILLEQMPRSCVVNA